MAELQRDGAWYETELTPAESKSIAALERRGFVKCREIYSSGAKYYELTYKGVKYITGGRE